MREFESKNFNIQPDLDIPIYEKLYLPKYPFQEGDVFFANQSGLGVSLDKQLESFYKGLQPDQETVENITLMQESVRRVAGLYQINAYEAIDEKYRKDVLFDLVSYSRVPLEKADCLFRDSASFFDISIEATLYQHKIDPESQLGKSLRYASWNNFNAGQDKEHYMQVLSGYIRKGIKRATGLKIDNIEQAYETEDKPADRNSSLSHEDDTVEKYLSELSLPKRVHNILLALENRDNALLKEKGITEDEIEDAKKIFLQSMEREKRELNGYDEDEVQEIQTSFLISAMKNHLARFLDNKGVGIESVFRAFYELTRTTDPDRKLTYNERVIFLKIYNYFMPDEQQEIFFANQSLSSTTYSAHFSSCIKKLIEEMSFARTNVTFSILDIVQAVEKETEQKFGPLENRLKMPHTFFDLIKGFESFMSQDFENDTQALLAINLPEEQRQIIKKAIEISYESKDKLFPLAFEAVLGKKPTQSQHNNTRTHIFSAWAKILQLTAGREEGKLKERREAVQLLLEKPELLENLPLKIQKPYTKALEYFKAEKYIPYIDRLPLVNDLLRGVMERDMKKEKEVETIPPHTTGQLLQREREKLKVTQETVGENMSVTRALVNNIEKRKNSTFYNIAKYIFKGLQYGILDKRTIIIIQQAIEMETKRAGYTSVEEKDSMDIHKIRDSFIDARLERNISWRKYIRENSKATEDIISLEKVSVQAQNLQTFVTAIHEAGLDANAPESIVALLLALTESLQINY